MLTDSMPNQNVYAGICNGMPEPSYVDNVYFASCEKVEMCQVQSGVLGVLGNVYDCYLCCIYDAETNVASEDALMEWDCISQLDNDDESFCRQLVECRNR